MDSPHSRGLPTRELETRNACRPDFPHRAGEMTGSNGHSDGVDAPRHDVKAWRSLVGPLLVAAALGVRVVGQLPPDETRRRAPIFWAAPARANGFDARERIGPALILTVPLDTWHRGRHCPGPERRN